MKFNRYSPPRTHPHYLDPTPFPKIDGYLKQPLVGVKMPNFIKDEELRKGPHHQATVTWMNDVQTHLDDFTSWDFLLNKTFGAITHTDAKACQVARINPRHVESHFAFHMKDEKGYIEEDLGPAICCLVWYERARLEKLGILPAGFPYETAEAGPSQSKKGRSRGKRKLEEDSEIQQAAKRKKADQDKKVGLLIGSDINERLCGVEKEILELVTGET